MQKRMMRIERRRDERTEGTAERKSAAQRKKSVLKAKERKRGFFGGGEILAGDAIAGRGGRGIGREVLGS